MVVGESRRRILSDKQNHVRTVVMRIAKKRDLALPNINFDGCSQEDDTHLAHYHPDQHLICISERQLEKHTIDDLDDTIAHEMSHIRVHGHGDKFSKEEELSRLASFNPKRAGTVFIEGSGTGPLQKNPTFVEVTRNVNMNECGYHDCKENKKLTSCSYCQRYFCQKHLEANVPSIETEPGEYAGHPCPEKVDANIAQDERYKDSLRTLLSKKTRSKPEPPIVHLHESYAPHHSKAKEQTRHLSVNQTHPRVRSIPKTDLSKSSSKSNNARYVGYGLAILAIGLIVILFFNYAGEFGAFRTTNYCSDGTPVRSCSGSSFYCSSERVLVMNATLCGCPSGFDLKQNSCVKGRCSDGTLEGDCSFDKPYECVGGKLLAKSTKCGCREGFYAKDDLCWR